MATLAAPHSLPIYREGALAFFADVRTFMIDPISACVSRRTDTEGGSSSGVSSVPPDARAGAAAAFNPATQIITGLEGARRPFNLDACFKMGEGVER